MGFDFTMIAPLLPSHCGFYFVFGCGVSFLVSSSVFLLMIVQQLVVILVFSQEGVRACPSTPPSWFLLSPIFILFDSSASHQKIMKIYIKCNQERKCRHKNFISSKIIHKSGTTFCQYTGTQGYWEFLMRTSQRNLLESELQMIRMTRVTLKYVIMIRIYKTRNKGGLKRRGYGM